MHSTWCRTTCALTAPRKAPILPAPALDAQHEQRIRAKVLAASGDGAVAEYDGAVTIIEKVVGPDPPRVAGVIAERGEVQLARGKTAAAIADLERAHAIFAKTFDASHETDVEAAKSLARARSKQKPGPR